MRHDDEHRAKDERRKRSSIRRRPVNVGVWKAHPKPIDFLLPEEAFKNEGLDQLLEEMDR